MDYKGLEYLRKKLKHHKTRVDLKYAHYDQKYTAIDPGVVVPARVKAMYLATPGWCAKAVDALADRLVFRGFENDYFGLNDIYNQNNADILYDSAILSALISSCCFIYITADEQGLPRLQIIDGANATGIIDPITGLLTEGYAVLKRSDTGIPTKEAYFIESATTIIDGEKGRPETYTIPNPAGIPLLVPIIHRPDAVRPFGRSRITRAAMYYQTYAKRTLERADITSEFYCFPQKYVVGMHPEAEPLDTWKATITSLLSFSKDQDGDKPQLGQFTQSSMSPFTEQLRTAAAGFAGETGLTLDDLGFISDNPSSAEAIKASHEGLRIAALKAQRCFGTGFKNAGFVAACLRDSYSYKRSELHKTEPKWEPVFEADAAALNLIGDGCVKLNQAIPGFINGKVLRDLTGVDGAINE